MRRDYSLPGRTALHQLRRASGCLGTSRGSSHGLSSNTSTTPRVRVPRHIARLITRLVAPLVVDYFSYSTRLVVSARYAACRVTHRRLLRLAQARTPRVWVPRHLAQARTPRVRVPRHLMRLVAAHRRLYRLRLTSGCLGTSHGSSSTTSPRAGSSSTSSPTPRVRVPRHVARLVVNYFASCRLVVDFVAYAARPGASARRAARRRLLRLAQARRRLLRLTQARTSCVRVPRHEARLFTQLVVD
jgi:hypothetical protein